VQRVALLSSALVGLLAVGAAAREEERDPVDGPASLRVETQLFAAGDEPVARSLTLFADGVAWDFLELPVGDGGLEVVEIVLHDPARERVVVVDPARHLKTQIDTIRLERLGASLAKWARRADDRLVRWAGGPDFAAGFTEREGRLELAGPRVRYVVAHEPAPSAEAAVRYRRFADTAILLKALLHPGGVLPFPRLAINDRLAQAAALPVEVTLELDSAFGALQGRAGRLRSVHKIHPRLINGDPERIHDAEAQVAASESVELPAYMGSVPADAARPGAPGS